MGCLYDDDIGHLQLFPHLAALLCDFVHLCLCSFHLGCGSVKDLGQGQLPLPKLPRGLRVLP